MKTLKKFKSLSIIFIISILMSVCIPISANAPVTVYINNEQISFDVDPMLINGRTMVPMRAIFEKLGATVLWDDDTNTATAYKDATNYISLTIGSSSMSTAFNTIELDVPAMIVNNRTLIPLRAVSEAFECTVNWHEDTNSVMIYTADFSEHYAPLFLTMATNAAFPPYEFIEGGELKGIDIEIAQAIADELGAELAIVDMEFDAIISSVQTGKADFGMAGITATAERLMVVNASTSYLSNTQVVIVPENSTVSDPWSDLYRKTIGTRLGTTGDIYAKDDFGEENVVSYSTSSDAITALKNGEVDAVIIDGTFADTFDFQNTGLKILEYEYCIEDYVIFVKIGNDELLDSINAAIEKLTTNGTIDAIVAKYIR